MNDVGEAKHRYDQTKSAADRTEIIVLFDNFAAWRLSEKHRTIGGTLRVGSDAGFGIGRE